MSDATFVPPAWVEGSQPAGIGYAGDLFRKAEIVTVGAITYMLDDSCSTAILTGWHFRFDDENQVILNSTTMTTRLGWQLMICGYIPQELMEIAKNHSEASDAAIRGYTVQTVISDECATDDFEPSTPPGLWTKVREWQGMSPWESEELPWIPSEEELESTTPALFHEAVAVPRFYDPLDYIEVSFTLDPLFSDSEDSEGPQKPQPRFGTPATAEVQPMKLQRLRNACADTETAPVPRFGWRG